MVPEAEADQYEQIVSTSDQTLDVGIYTIPGTPQLKIDFLKSGTETIQQHIDYRVTIMNDASGVYVHCTGGLPCTDILWHTSPGSVTIPLEFSLPSGDPSNGLHILDVAIEGILFQPIPLEYASFMINVEDDAEAAAEAAAAEAAAAEVVAAEVSAYLDIHSITFANYDQLDELAYNYPDYVRALHWENVLRPFIDNSNDQLSFLNLLNDELWNLRSNALSIEQQTQRYNPDGTESEEWTIATINQHLQYISSIVMLMI